MSKRSKNCIEYCKFIKYNQLASQPGGLDKNNRTRYSKRLRKNVPFNGTVPYYLHDEWVDGLFMGEFKKRKRIIKKEIALEPTNEQIKSADNWAKQHNIYD